MSERREFSTYGTGLRVDGSSVVPGGLWEMGSSNWSEAPSESLSSGGDQGDPAKRAFTLPSTPIVAPSTTSVIHPGFSIWLPL